MLHVELDISTEGDGRFDLDHGGELERRGFLECDLLEIRLFHGPEMSLGQRLPIHLGNQVARHLLTHVVPEMQLDHAAGDLALAEAGQPRLALHARERSLPGLLNHLGGLLDVEAPLACSHLLNVNLHRGSRIWCERGELNPHGLPLWILSPARLPIPPLSQSECKAIRGRSSLFAEAVQMTAPCGEVRTRPLHRSSGTLRPRISSPPRIA